jgi:hypothetical protein
VTTPEQAAPEQAAPERFDANISGGIAQRIEQINPDALTRDQLIRATALSLALQMHRFDVAAAALQDAAKFATWIERGEQAGDAT